MGILDLYIQPPVIDDEEAIKEFKEYARQKLTKGKSKAKRHLCSHPNVTYQKWVHEGPVQGKSFHFKEICNDCGSRRNVPRTKEIYELVKNEKWHKKRK